MPDQLQDILKELYAVEPTLAQREAELVPIIQKLLAAKPDVQVDPAFREKLRTQLIQKTLQTSPVTFFAMRKFSYALFAVFVVAIAGVGAYSLLQKQNASPSQTTTLTQGLLVTNRESAAFGTLGVISTAPKQSGGGTSLTAEDASSRSSLIAPVPTQNVRYEYKGDALTLPALPVLKRVKGFSGTNVQGILTSLNAPLAKMESFANLAVQQVTFAENKENGYTITLDALAGTASIYQNWERWAVSSKAMPETATARDLNNLPADNELIAVATAFLETHGISREGYGTPVVRKDWLALGTSMPAYYPSDVSVVFPLMVDGKTVVDGSGQAFGLNVSVNLATKLVSSVNNITGLRFEASSYPMVDTAESVLEIVRRGGMYSTRAAEDAKALTVEVGTPIVAYFYSSYQLDGGASDVLVPALIFPFTKVPTGAPVYGQNIVVPLVKELIQVPEIMPLTSGGSAGSPAEVQVDTPTTTIKE